MCQVCDLNEGAMKKMKSTLRMLRIWARDDRKDFVAPKDWFSVKVDGKVLIDPISDVENVTRNWFTATWWHENPTAKVVKVEFREKE